MAAAQGRDLQAQGRARQAHSAVRRQDAVRQLERHDGLGVPARRRGARSAGMQHARAQGARPDLDGGVGRGTGDRSRDRPRGDGDALLWPSALGRDRRRVLRRGARSHRCGVPRDPGEAGAGLAHAFRERRGGARARAPLGAHGRPGVAATARPPARSVRRRRGAALPVRRHAAPCHGLGAQPRDPHRDLGPQGRGTGVRDAPARASDLPAAQSRGPEDRRPPDRHRVSRHHLLPSGVHPRRARGSAGVSARVLGRTGLSVSPVGFGGWAIGGNRFGNSYGPTDDAESQRAVRRAYELGCNFFDTADVYGHGHSEALLGEALAGIRQDVIVATKVGGNFYNRDVSPLLVGRISDALGSPLAEVAPDAALPVTHDANFSPSYVRFAVHQSLRRLRTDYIDLLQLHNPALGLIADPETYDVLEDLKREGKIRWYGVSVHPPEEGLAAIQAARPDTIQIVYNIVRREPEDALFLAARVKQLAGQAGVTAAQLALRFVLDNEAVSVVIVGMKTVVQVEENLSVER